MFEEIQHLRDHHRRVHHEGMRDRQHDMIRHSLDPGRGDRDLAIIRPGQDHRIGRAQRPVPGDHAQVERDRPQMRGQALGPGAKLHPRRSVDPVEHRDIAQRIHQLRPLVGRGQHHHPAKVGRLMRLEPRAHKDATHRMGHEMHRVVAAIVHRPRQGLDHERHDGLLGRRVSGPHHPVTFGFKNLFHHQERHLAARQPMKQHDTIRPRHHGKHQHYEEKPPHGA